MEGSPDTWYQEISIEFSDGSTQALHIERRDTGTHIPSRRETPKPWTELEFNKCSSCTLPAMMRYCPAAQSLQGTMGKLRSRASTERVTAKVVDGRGRTQTFERDLQGVGATLVRLAVFETACPVGYRLKPYLAGLSPFSDSMGLMRHITRKILEKHGGSEEKAKQELREALAPLQEVFLKLIQRLRNDVLSAKAPGSQVINDAVPNSIVQVDAIAQRFSMKVDDLCAEIANEIGWTS